MGGGLDPPVAVPTANEIVSPLPADDVLQPAGRRFGKRTQGVAVEIDDPRRQFEQAAIVRQGIGLIP